MPSAIYIFIIQIDLIDMQHNKLPHNKWILHCVEHWSKCNDDLMMFTAALPSSESSYLQLVHYYNTGTGMCENLLHMSPLCLRTNMLYYATLKWMNYVSGLLRQGKTS